MPDAVMIFAAGLGTRMGALTADRPKPLIPVAGRPLIDHALALVDRAGITRRVANLHYKPELLARHLAAKGIETVLENPALLDTGGGLRNALPRLGKGPVFTLNSDAVWTGPNPIAALRTAWDPARMDALLMLVPRDNATGHEGKGDFTIAPDGRIARGTALVYTGLQIISPEGIEDMPEGAFSLNLMWDRMLARGRLFGLVHPGGWCDVGHPDGIPLAEAMLRGSDDV